MTQPSATAEGSFNVVLASCPSALIADIWDRTVTDARDAELGKPTIRWHAVHNHYVHGSRDTLANPPDQRIVHQAGNEEA